MTKFQIVTVKNLDTETTTYYVDIQRRFLFFKWWSRITTSVHPEYSEPKAFNTKKEAQQFIDEWRDSKDERVEITYDEY